MPVHSRGLFRRAYLSAQGQCYFVFRRMHVGQRCSRSIAGVICKECVEERPATEASRCIRGNAIQPDVWIWIFERTRRCCGV